MCPYSEMATQKVNNISNDILRWTYRRAGFQEEKAIEAFPLLGDWLSGEKKPTMSNLEKFARKFHVPFGYLFLDEVPQERIPFRMFRGKAGKDDHFDLNVYDTVMNISSRQEWLEDYLEENDIQISPLVGVITTKTPVYETVRLLREHLRLEMQWAFDLKSSEEAVNLLTERLEDCGGVHGIQWYRGQQYPPGARGQRMQGICPCQQVRAVYIRQQ